VSVETCDEQIAQENDHLMLEVKRLKQMVSEIMKQAKVRPSKDNYRNMVNKLEKGSNVTKQASQPSNKAQSLKKQQKTIEEEKLKHARSAYMNARRPHIKSRIGYKNGAEHNSRVNTRGQEFIEFTKVSVQQVKKQSIKTTNNVSYSYANISHVSHMSYHDFHASYVLIGNNFEKSIALHVGPHHKRSKTCVSVPKYLVTNLRGPNPTWVPKTKA
jgi:hypothetical protein